MVDDIKERLIGIIKMKSGSDKKPFVVGIAGGTASGKSTLCGILAERLPEVRTATVHSDSFFLKNLPKIKSPKSGIIYDDYNHPDSLDKAGFFAAVRSLTKADADLILIDSLFTLYYEELKQILDFKIFIDLPSDERLVRRVRRNIGRGFTPEEIITYYNDTVVYRHAEFVEPTRVCADLVIRGDYGEAEIGMITDRIKKGLN